MGVVILPYDSNGDIYILLKDRPNIGAHCELPRGTLENEETYIEGGLRELFEETGMLPVEGYDM